MTESSQSSSLVELERRWRDERSPQLALHLAEEHRRTGNLARAIEVVREGLVVHPGHVAGRVALGRFLLEKDRADEAVSTLESVVADDPTHLVACKLLVEAFLRRKDAVAATNRFEIYKALSPADPDLEAMETRLASLGRAEAGAVGEAAAPDLPEPSRTGDADRDPFGSLMSLPESAAVATALAGEGIFQLASELARADDEAAPAALPGDPAVDAANATATLGRLYRDQGHSREAEAIFEAVLDKEPGNADVAAELGEMRGVGKQLRADDLLDAAALAGLEVSERKQRVLESYRQVLRKSVARGA